MMKVLLTSLCLALVCQVSLAADAKKKPVKKAATKTTAPAKAPKAADANSTSATATPDVSAASTPAAATTTAPTAPAAASTSTEFQQGWQNFHFAYTGVFEGGYINHLDGQNGPGSTLVLTHYPSFKYKFHPNYSVSVSQGWYQHLGADSHNNPEVDDNPEQKPSETFEPATDPYVTVSAGSLWTAGNFKLPTFLRYYVPVFLGTRTNGTRKDVAYGKFRFQTTPTYNAFDNLLELSCPSRMEYFIPGIARDYASRTGTSYYSAGTEAPAGTKRVDYRFLFLPTIAVNVTDKFQPYVQWISGYIHHHAVGGYTSIDDSKAAAEGRGHGMEVGFNYTITDKLSINPYLDFGAANAVNQDYISYNIKQAAYAIGVDYSFF